MAASLFALVAVSCVALSAAFTPPAQYTAEAVMMLPYAGIAEPIRVYFDGVSNKSRTEYYEGQDVYIFRPDLFTYGTQYTVIPETNDSQLNVRSCVQTNGTADNTISIQSFLPDLSTFKLLGNVSKRGVLCEDWFYQYQGGTRTNTYHLYVEVATQTPLQYYMSGYDSLLGSHYDEYVLNYLTWTPGPIADPSVFDAPNLPCGNFPGPGAMTGDRGALALVEDPVAEEQRVEKAFSEFKTKHGKTYASEHEHIERMAIFRKNSRYISAMNRRHLSYSLAVNRFADFRHSELKAMRGSVSTRRSKGPAAPVAATDLPTSWDWRDKGAVSPVKDQGICGSCWSFATAQTIESSLFLKTGKMTPLSPQSLVDCSWGFGNNGCDGGEAERAFGWILQQGGIPSEASYGVYEMADGLCHSKQAAIGASISSYVNVTSGDLTAVADALYTHGPLSIAIDAGHLSFVFYSSGVYYEPTCKSGEDDLDHAVLLIGWGVDPTDGAYWIVKNSWSEYWGDNGYVKMSQKDNNCGVATDTNYVIIQ